MLVPFYAEYQSWWGGLNYLRSFIAAMALLPAGKRPDLFIISYASESWPDEVIAAWQSPAVAAVLQIDGTILYGRNERVIQRLSSTPPANRCHLLEQSVDITFPVFSSDYGEKELSLRQWLWIPDLQHRHRPEFFSAQELAFRDRTYTMAARRPGPLILSSHAAQNDIRAFVPNHAARLYVWQFRSLVRPLPSVEVAEIRQRYGLPERFLYIPNQFWIHKDHRTAFHALALLRGRGMAIDLVCTGSPSDPRAIDHYRHLFEEAKTLGVADAIHHLGVVPHRDVIGLMQAATRVVQPSLWEGWNTTVEDSIALGLSIVASDLPVHREQLGEQGCLFRAGNPLALADALGTALDESLATCPTADYDALRRDCAYNFLRIIEAERALLGPRDVIGIEPRQA
ncbi:glycosyltransferase [Azospirillum doebereinerae]